MRLENKEKKMILEDWLKKNRVKTNHFAARVGVSRSLMYKMVRGHKRCTVNTAVLIEKATKGEVSRMECLFPDEFIEKRENGDVQQRFTAKSLFND